MIRLAAGPRALLGVAIAAYAAGFGALSVLRHRAFETGRFDLGNMVQVVWSTAHGHPLRMTDLRGEQVSRLAAHFDPILAAFAPLWWVWPSPDALLVAQAVAVALGALPVFLLARRRLGSERAALGFALAYLLLPAVQWLTLNEFHPVALACPLLLFAFERLDADRLGSFAVLALLAAATKEEVALVVAGFGLWYALARRRRVAGGLVVLAGVLWSALAIGVVIPHFNEGASSFYSRYEGVGGSPGGVLRTAVHDPGRLLEAAASGRDLRYVAELALPLACLFLAAPLVLVAAVPELALNLLADTTTQTSIRFHYTAALVPPLVVGSVLGAARITRRRPSWTLPLAGAAVVVALAANGLLGALPLRHDLPGTSVTRHDEVAERALRLVPSNAVVSATNTLGAHLSARRRILSFPELRDATWIAFDETKPSWRDRSSDRVRAPARLAALRRSDAWRVVFERDGVLVLSARRSGSAASSRARTGRPRTASTRARSPAPGTHAPGRPRAPAP